MILKLQEKISQIADKNEFAGTLVSQIVAGNVNVINNMYGDIHM